MASYRILKKKHNMGLRSEDFRARVIAGDVPGWKFVRGFGEREDMGVPVNGEDIWRGNDTGVGGANLIPLIDSAGIQLAVKSSSTDDTDEWYGTGAKTINITVIRADGSVHKESKTMDGTTGVNLSISDAIHVQELHTTTVGTNGVAVGNITVYATSGGTVYNLIAKGGNQSMTNARMCPVGHKLIVMGWDVEVSSNDRIAFRLRSTDENGVLLRGVFLFKDAAYIAKSNTGQLVAGIEVPPFSIVKISGWGDQAGGESSASWWGYLVTTT